MHTYSNRTSNRSDITACIKAKCFSEVRSLKFLLFGNILQHHVDIDIKAFEGTNKLLISFHYHPQFWPYTAVNQLCFQQKHPISSFYQCIIEAKEESKAWDNKWSEEHKPDGRSCDGLLAMETQKLMNALKTYGDIHVTP